MNTTRFSQHIAATFGALVATVLIIATAAGPVVA